MTMIDAYLNTQVLSEQNMDGLWVDKDYEYDEKGYFLWSEIVINESNPFFQKSFNGRIISNSIIFYTWTHYLMMIS